MKTGIEIFLTLRRHSTQNEMLRAAAKHALSKGELLVFDKILKNYSRLGAHRNDIAHGIFGTCPDDASIVFWIHAKDYAHFNADVLHSEAQGEGLPDPHKKLRESLFVLKKSSLDLAYREIEELWWIVHYFLGYVKDPENFRRKAEFDKLKEHKLLR